MGGFSRWSALLGVLADPSLISGLSAPKFFVRHREDLIHQRREAVVLGGLIRWPRPLQVISTSCVDVALPG